MIEKFTLAMSAKGLSPARSADIIADGKRRDFQIEGDPRTKKKGFYRLTITPLLAHGYFGDYREGGFHSFSSRVADHGMDAGERSRLQRARQEAKLAQEAEDERERRDKAARAQRFWDAAGQVTDHAYLSRKGVAAKGLRQARGLLLVPARDAEGRLRDVQRITADGDKKFLPGKMTNGLYHALAHERIDAEYSGPILICEGYSTAASCFLATGFPSVCAFTAGGLMAVGRSVAHRYKAATILFCADNDQWSFTGSGWLAAGKPDKGMPGDAPQWAVWRNAGFLCNTGVESAEKAATAIKARLCVPAIPADDADRLTDFNDVMLRHGAAEVEKQISAVLRGASGSGAGGNIPLPPGDVVVVQPAGPDYDGPAYGQDDFSECVYHDEIETERTFAGDRWENLLVRSAKGKIEKTSQRNAIIFLRYQRNFLGVFAYNQFSGQVCINACPPWQKERDFRVRELANNDITQTVAELEPLGLSVGAKIAEAAIKVVAEVNAFHPAREHFAGLKWDGVERLDTWLTYYMGCEEDNPAYLAFVGRKWLTAAVRRVYLPGCKFDHVLVMEGEQGRGKSTFLKELATFGDEPETYHTDAVLITALSDKDSVMKCQGVLIVELSELSGFSKKDDEEIKHWITLQADEIRIPFERVTKKFQRQFIIAATTNKYEYLKDPTGNRRYWPVKTGGLDVEAVRRDREQLWAEAAHYYREGLYVGPTIEEAAMAREAQRKRLSEDVWTDQVLRIAKDRGRSFKVADVMQDMGILLRERDEKAARRITGILSAHGYISKPIWNADLKKNERQWILEALA